MDDSDPHRDKIHEALQESAGKSLENEKMLVGWVVVCDWMDADGERWLTKCHSASIPEWAANGMHHEALHWAEARPDGDDT